jgi:farnesyl diphosphate synthase
MGLLLPNSSRSFSRKNRMAKVADPTKRFKQRLDQVAADTERLLDRLMARKLAPGELARPARLLEAMRYASLGGGKRLRPFLVVESAKLFGVPRRQALMVAAALECVHCYSLVHDDLPAMDDDSLRRGRPTTHKAFDEATAILAGDGLLTFAFDILSRPQTHAKPDIRIHLISALARAAGVGGMAGGQILDLAAEGRFANSRTRPLGVGEVRLLQSMKTGALLKYACVSGTILGKSGQKARTALGRYGAAIGEAFQIADDLLDLEGDAATVGKATGKDAAAHKATFLSLLGIKGARKRLKTLIVEAETAIASFGNDGAILRAAAHFIGDRRS